MRRQLGDILKLTLVAVVGVQAIGNWPNVLALGRLLNGDAVAFRWDVCAGLGPPEALLAQLTAVSALSILTVAVVSSSRLPDRRGDADDQAGPISALRLMSGLVKASAGFAAAGAALALVQVAALLAVGTPWQGSCTPAGGAFLTVLLAALGVLVACLLVLPISSLLETRRFVGEAELRRVQRQLERLEAWAPRRDRAGWWRLLRAVTQLAAAVAVPVLVLGWLARPNLPLPAARELAPQLWPVIAAHALALLLLITIPAVVAWWAVSVDLLGFARGLAVLSWLLSLGLAGQVIARAPAGADLGPLHVAVLVLPISLVVLRILGVLPYGRDPGGLALVLVRRLLVRELAVVRLEAESAPDPTPRRGLANPQRNGSRPGHLPKRGGYLGN